MSGRKLGGGRILGSGKGLAPPTPQAAPRAASPVAPSESSIGSLASTSSSPPPSAGLTDLAQDLGATISVGAQAKTGADTGALVCPICSEEMVTLLQLNRHIDDTHQELPEEAQDEVKTWFDKQVIKAKRFQPLSIINSKIRGLDVFESNESTAPPVPAGPGKLPLEGPIDPDELITRSHWQRTTSHDYCTDPTCGRSLGPIGGSINCRHCGRLFCEAHTMYQMKLSRSAKHDPVRGYWARVCETCFVSRDGYNDHQGAVTDHTHTFAEMRRKRVEREALEVSRLEKRLTKLTQLLTNPPENLAQQSNGSLLSPVTALAGQRNARKMIEQSIVTWEDDNTVSKCPFCQQEFGSWTFRRHHCRICGRVVCADPATGCSSEVGLDVSQNQKNEALAPNGQQQLTLDVRMCRSCKHTIFSGRDFAASLAHKPPDQKAYETLRLYERSVKLLLPPFHRALVNLQPERSDTGEIDLDKPPPTRAQIEEAAKLRKRLVDSFNKYSVAARKIKELPTDKRPMQERLQAAVYAHASAFLHTNMLPLKSVPDLLRNASSSRSSAASSSSSKQLTSSHLRHSELANDPSPAQTAARSVASTEDDNSTAVSQLESEERSLRERLVVLEEQKFMVEGMVKTARNARRFEEVTALGRNLEELEGEIRDLKMKVGEVESRWEGMYGSGRS